MAWHEAGHGAARYAVSAPGSVAFVPCRRCDNHAGVMVSVQSATRSRIFAKFAAEHILDEAFALHFDVRAELERDILVALAGAIAERYAAPAVNGYFADPPCTLAAERVAKALAQLSPRHAELLERSEAEPADDDDVRAREESELVARSEAGWHLVWLRAVADRLVAERASSIERLALVLLDRPAIPGDEAEAILAGWVSSRNA